MRPQGVDRGQAAAQHGVVHGIVVHQGRQVHQFDGRRQGNGGIPVSPAYAVRQEHQGGSKHLAPHEQEVLVHLVGHSQIGANDAPELLAHALQILSHRLLDVGKRGWVRGDGLGQLPHS